ncbi:VOC family protein [Aquabacterium sp. NJ1]|uniref:VOC family protein n=1 Tax=Aquabacterium sp. NJ1 TaxID=1538295 RepID=UPI000690343E|nr:VOC family protein [Aquabacterium sp. NJ1]
MTSPTVLHTPPEYPESQRPDFVQRLHRPEPLMKARELAFLMFDKRDLVRAERFWQDFGLITVSRTADRLVMRAAGGAPAVLVATRARRSRYVGAAFVAPEGADLPHIARQLGGQAVPPDQVPGGGRAISLRDPDGHRVWLIQGSARVDPLPVREPITNQINTLTQTPRVNATVRPPIAPARIGRLGHVVMQTTDFRLMADWYMRVLGIIPTDVQYLPDGQPLLTFFRLDLGGTPSDHHTVVIAGGLEPKYEHSAWEVEDIDALGQGQQVLKANGHRHMWGIGRHVLGSQLFDYWYDPDGFEFEHYTDGDVFTADHETRYVPFAPGSIWAWGDDVPPTMLPKKSPALLWKVFKLWRSGRLDLPRLIQSGKVLDTPARPWL